MCGRGVDPGSSLICYFYELTSIEWLLEKLQKIWVMSSRRILLDISDPVFLILQTDSFL